MSGANQHPIHGCKDPLAMAALADMLRDRYRMRGDDADEASYLILRAANPKMFDPRGQG